MRIVRSPSPTLTVDGELIIERTFYNGEEIRQPYQHWTQQQQMELIDWHPMFTGRCPQCGAEFDTDYTLKVHWDCECGFLDDTV